MRRLLVILLASAVSATTGLGQGQIELRPAATVSDGPVTLGQVAELSGREALALADVVITDDPGALLETEGWRHLDLETVRAALDAHDAPWGALSLRGGACALRIGEPIEGAAAGQAGQPMRRAPGGFEPGSVGAAVSEQIASALGVEPGAFRIAFEPADHAALARPAEGLIVKARPTGLGERTPIALRIYRGDWIETESTVRAQIEIRRQVATARRDLRRGEIISADDVSISEAWLAPDAAPAPDAIGAVARTHIAAGAIVMQTDTEAPLVVRRRDRVTVDIVSGTIEMQVKMRALEDGRIGDVIQFESMEPDRRDRRQIEARVNGAGRAVAMVGNGK